MLISFQLNHLSDIVFELYDLLGEKRGTISLQGIEAGDHELQINNFIPDLPNGNYIYYLQVSNPNENFTECRSVSF